MMMIVMKMMITRSNLALDLGFYLFQNYQHTQLGDQRPGRPGVLRFRLHVFKWDVGSSLFCCVYRVEENKLTIFFVTRRYDECRRK